LKAGRAQVNKLLCERSSGEDAAQRLCELLVMLQSRYPALLTQIRRVGTQLILQLVASRSAAPRQGELLEQLIRQGQLIRLFHLHLQGVTELELHFEEPRTDTLYVRAGDNVSPQQMDRFIHSFDRLLELLSHRRADLLLRPWTGRPASLGTPYTQRHNDFTSDDSHAAGCQTELWQLTCPASPLALVRLDENLLVYDDEEASAVGAIIAPLLQPFLRASWRTQIANRTFVMHDVCAPSGKSLARAVGLLAEIGSGVERTAVNASPSLRALLAEQLTGILSCDGAALSDWILQELISNVSAIGSVDLAHVTVERWDGSAGVVQDCREREQLRIVQLLPGADPTAVLPSRNCIIVDVFGLMSGRPDPQWAAQNVVYVRGATLRVWGRQLAMMPEAGSHQLTPAQMELLLLETSAPSARDQRRSTQLYDLVQLAAADVVALDALRDAYGEIDAPHWQAFHARRRGDLQCEELTEQVTALHAPLAEVPRDAGNIFEHMFSERHLRASSSIVDPSTGCRVSYEQMYQMACVHAGRLRALGLQRGDVVAFVRPEGAAAVAVMLACFVGGWVFAPLDAGASIENFELMLATVSPRIVLFERTAAASHALAIQRLANLEWGAFIALASAALTGPVSSMLHEAAVMLFTSGSSGKPKAVVHTHGDFLTCSRNYVPHVLRLNSGDCVYTPSRMTFAYGLNNLVITLLAGASAVLAMPLAASQSVTDVIAGFDVSIFMAVPVIFKLALSAPSRPNFPALKLCVSAGERLPPKLYMEATSYFGVPVLDGIGNAEAISTFISNRTSCTAPGCTGTIVPGFRARLLNDGGRLCRIGEVGTLWIKGATVAKGYLGESASAGHSADGWFNTQDMFYIDAYGRFHNVGRVSSVIKINACWFSSDILEATLRLHPAIVDCAVCMIADEHGLPRPKAFVVLDDVYVGANDLEELWRELSALSKQRLGKDYYPHLFSAVGDLPRTSSGKVMKYVLSQTVEVEDGNKYA